MGVLKPLDACYSGPKGNSARVHAWWGSARGLLLGLGLMFVTGCAVHEPNSDGLVAKAERDADVSRDGGSSPRCASSDGGAVRVIGDQWRSYAGIWVTP